VIRVHSLAEKKTCSTAGGVHSFAPMRAVQNTKTGDIIGMRRKANADLQGEHGHQTSNGQPVGQT
jgi:hypothetical protein